MAGHGGIQRLANGWSPKLPDDTVGAFTEHPKKFMKYAGHSGGALSFFVLFLGFF